MAETVAGTGITVNSVLPGPTESEGVATFVADLARQRGVDRSVVEAEFFQSARPTSLLKRFATVEEVGQLINGSGDGSTDGGNTGSGDGGGLDNGGSDNNRSED